MGWDAKKKKEKAKEQEHLAYCNHVHELPLREFFKSGISLAYVLYMYVAFICYCLKTYLCKDLNI